MNILVAYDGSPSSRAALEHAYELARTQNSKLTVITVSPPPAAYVSMAGVNAERMKDELDEWASRLAREATAGAPDGVIVHTVQRHGHAGPEIVAEIESGSYDLVVLGSRGRGRISSEILGSVNAFVHFHTKIAMLSIDEPSAA
ncbi:MAG TPA: universal stress protein [Gaiellaceae bacterium]